MKSFGKLSVLAFLAVLGLVVAVPSHPQRRLDPRTVRRMITTDFESGTMSPWYDTSPGDVKWTVEDVDKPTESYAVPALSGGSRYLRAKRFSTGSYGMAVLRSLEWTAFPGDQISLSFWIRSKYASENTLEVYWLNGTQEVRLMSLTQFSSINNLEWRNRTATLPITSSITTSLIIYGYCGANIENAITIDNLSLIGLEDTTTAAAITTTTPTTTVTTTTTTTTATTTTTTVPTTEPTKATTEPTPSEEPSTTGESTVAETTPSTAGETTSVESTTVEETTVQETSTAEPTTTEEPSTTTVTTTSPTTTRTTTTTQTPSSGCPAYLGTENVPCYSLAGTCYCFSNYMDTWYNAESTCNKHLAYRMKLVSIQTAEEQQYIANHIKSTGTLANYSHFWTSGNDIDLESYWKWSATGAAIGYTNWGPQQPDDVSQDEDCMRIRKDYNYQWEDATCWYTSFFICEGNQ